MKSLSTLAAVFCGLVLMSCGTQPKKENKEKVENVQEKPENMVKLEQYAKVKLTADLKHLSDNQKEMLKILFQVADIMDQMFKYEVLENPDKAYNDIAEPFAQELFKINYGPWNRLDGNKSFIKGIGEKPKGANFYPADITEKEFNEWDNNEKSSLYTFIRREGGALKAIPYHVMFAQEVKKAADLLHKAAELAEDEGFKKYLALRADALLNDEYFKSDMAWMEMKSNMIDFVVGPIETYEDQLFGAKAAHEAFILIKDMDWSEKLAKYAKFLPELQKGLPVDEKYKQEVPGSDSDLNAYDVIYYKGDCNAGSKTIAINLPNDEKVQEAKGSRRLQLKNAMKAKFDIILTPIAQKLIAEEQRSMVTFDAFFANTMFHEVAHGLGIRNTINGKGTVRQALKKRASALEEGKADMLGLYMVLELIKKGEYEGNAKESMVTFMAGIFRSIRFGSSSAHGKANLVRFNYFKEKGAFTRQENGTYLVNFEKMVVAMNSLSELILTIQGDGDEARLIQLMKEKAVIGEQLAKDLESLNAASIPVDVVWEQGPSFIGLQ